MMRATTFCLCLLSACGRTAPCPQGRYIGPRWLRWSVPNLDGTIEAAEVELVSACPCATWPPTARRAVPGQPTPGASGWNLSVDYADDRLATLEPPHSWAIGSPPASPTGSGLLPGPGPNLDGRVRRSDRALSGYLEREAAGQELVVYAQPVAIFRFPSAREAVGQPRQVSNATVRGSLFWEKYLPGAGRGGDRLERVTFTQTLAVRTTTTIEPAIGIHRPPSGRLDVQCFGEVPGPPP